MRKVLIILTAILLAFHAVAWAAAPQYTDIALHIAKDSTTTVTAKTTLPTGTEVGIWIYQATPPKALYSAVPDDYPHSLDIKVKDGTLKGSIPSVKEKGLPAGRYELVFTCPPSGKNVQTFRHPVTVKQAVTAQPKEWQEPKGWK